jgi:hypothetical protein
VSLLFLIIGLGAFGTEQQNCLQHDYELHRVRSSLFLLHLVQVSVRLEYLRYRYTSLSFVLVKTYSVLLGDATTTGCVAQWQGA